MLVGGEEELLALDLAAAGWKLAYDPAVVARYHPSPVRDPRRRRLLARNRALTTWMRYPAATALMRSVPGPRSHRLRAANWTPARGVMWAMRSALWAASRRRRVGQPLADLFVGRSGWPARPAGLGFGQASAVSRRRHQRDRNLGRARTGRCSGRGCHRRSHRCSCADRRRCG